MLNTILTIISIACTLISVVGAARSNIYYKKSKHLIIYANSNVAYIETKNIIDSFMGIMKLANDRERRGRNISKEVSKYGESIKGSINTIRDSLSADDCRKAMDILNSKELNTEDFIDSLIIGKLIENDKLVLNNDFGLCQRKIYDLQLFIKKRIEEVSDKLK